MSRQLLAAALAALVLTSGCSFLGGGGATPTANTDDATPTATATATATATPSPTPTSSGPDYPDGYGQLGVTNATVAASSHVESLASRQSFIVSTAATVLRENGTTRVQQLQSVDIRQDRALIAVNDSDSVQRTSYFADGTRYLRVNPPGENNSRYNVSDASFDPRGFTGATFVAPALEGVTYGTANVTETGNGTFFGYSATSVNRSAFPLLFGPSINASNVTDFDAGFVVDEEGIVRRMSYQATVDRGDETLVVDVRLETSSIDEVSVSEPTWVEEARRADSGS
jgi:hypothetical protein